MSDIRASEIKVGQVIDDYSGEELMTVATVSQHGDRVLITDSDGVEHSFDIDEVVEGVGHGVGAAKAPILARPDDDTTVSASAGPVAVSFSAGRRGAGSIDCLVCGKPIHQRDDSPGQPWYDGSGATRDVDLTGERHEHSPAREVGPTFGPFEYAELTYDGLRYDGGETLAMWDAQRGDWVLTDNAGEYAGEAYSDATIFAYGSTP